MPFPSGSFDMVMGFYSLHHLPLAEAASEFRRVLRPRGFLFFIEPNILNPIVFLIKSIPFLKKIVGDSPDEWALNPLTLKHSLAPLKKLHLGTSEFLLPTSTLPVDVLIALDRASSFLSRMPFFQVLGGSVALAFQKAG